MNKVVLHGYWRSSCSWRVRLVLNLKGISYQKNFVHLLKEFPEDVKQLNPAGMIPVLEIDGLILTESLPICEYIEEAYEG